MHEEEEDDDDFWEYGMLHINIAHCNQAAIRGKPGTPLTELLHDRILIDSGASQNLFNQRKFFRGELTRNFAATTPPQSSNGHYDIAGNCARIST